MQKNKITGYGIMLMAAAVLLITAGCVNYDLLPARVVVTRVIVSDSGGPLQNGHIFLHVAAPNNTATLTASVIGDNNAVITWSVIWGGELISLDTATGSEVTVSLRGSSLGTAKIRVEAANDYNWVTSDVNVVISSPGVAWTFAMYDSSKKTEINDTLVIAPGGNKVVTLTPVLDAAEPVTFNWAVSGGSPVVTLDQSTGDSVRINAVQGVTQGSSGIIVTALKSGSSLIKIFTVALGIEAEEGILFKWDSKTVPMSGTLARGSSINSGYDGIFFRVRNDGTGTGIETENGAFQLGNNNRLVIGGNLSSATVATNASGPPAVYGIFNFSRGTFRLTINYNNPFKVDPASSLYLLRIYINNNSTGRADSILGEEGLLRVYTHESHLTSGLMNTPGLNDLENEPGKIAITFTPGILLANNPGVQSLTNAFIALNCQETNRINITGIMLEEF